MSRSLYIGVAIAAILLVAPAAADAQFTIDIGTPDVISMGYSGVIKGRLTFYQANGGFCPRSRYSSPRSVAADCTGSNYNWTHFQTWSPVSNIRVELWENGRVIGRGSTNSNGWYTISWFSWTRPSAAYVRVLGQHKDDRFRLKNSSGSMPSWYTWFFTLATSTTASAPQNLGETRFGSAGAPDLMLNYYDAGEHTWWYGLMGSNAVYNNWGTVELRGFYTRPTNDECNSSGDGTCANGWDSFVKLDENARLQMTTVAHELGHVASWKINPFYQTGDYGYPMFCPIGAPYCNGSHDQESAEWQHVQFEEGFASFVATVALYQAFAPEPYFCTGNSRAYCPLNQYAIETSIGSSCTPTQRRAENQVTRYLWDYFDSVDDSEHDSSKYSDTVSTPFWRIYDALALFPDCTYGGCDDEHLSSDGTQYSERDGRNAYDFYIKTRNRTGHGNSWPQYQNNCGYNGNHGK